MKKNLNLFTVALFAVISLLCVTAGMAQTNTTGAVDGVVSDANGAVVPNAAVTLTGPNLIRAQTVNTDNDGMYRFLQIPPGRYTITTAPVSGFTAFKQDNIEVNLNQTTTVKVTLSSAAVGAVVDVVANS